MKYKVEMVVVQLCFRRFEAADDNEARAKARDIFNKHEWHVLSQGPLYRGKEIIPLEVVKLDASTWPPKPPRPKGRRRSGPG